MGLEHRSYYESGKFGSQINRVIFGLTVIFSAEPDSQYLLQRVSVTRLELICLKLEIAGLRTFWCAEYRVFRQKVP